MKSYTVHYRMHMADDVHSISILARNKYDAYDRATHEEIPKLTGGCPYSSWVYSVTYQNGNYRRFNTSEGNAY